MLVFYFIFNIFAIISWQVAPERYLQFRICTYKIVNVKLFLNIGDK